VDEALVEHAEDDVDHQDRGDDQQALALQRTLEELRRTREAAGDRRWQVDVAPGPRIALTASRSEMPGAVLNEIVTAGCWAIRLTASGPTLGLIVASDSSGAFRPLAALS
jgi:hypothetical protein